MIESTAVPITGTDTVSTTATATALIMVAWECSGHHASVRSSIHSHVLLTAATGIRSVLLCHLVFFVVIFVKAESRLVHVKCFHFFVYKHLFPPEAYHLQALYGAKTRKTHVQHTRTEGSAYIHLRICVCVFLKYISVYLFTCICVRVCAIVMVIILLRSIRKYNTFVIMYSQNRSV